MDFAGLSARVEELVRGVGSYQLESRDDLGVAMKGHRDPVTQVDLESERRLQEGLLELLPEASFRGEESGWSQFEGLCWIVDPLDGTKAYIGSRPGWGVSVALAEDDELLFGMTYFPEEDECYYAWRGGGAWRDGERIKVDPENRRVVVSSFFKDSAQEFDALVHDGAAWKASKVADGTFGAYPHKILDGKGVHLWDVAATVVIVSEAGGVAARFDGSAISACPKDSLVDCLFSNGLLDAELRSRFGKQL